MQTFAPGIPDKAVQSDIPISSGDVWRINIQRHDALRAGSHEDLRLNPPNSDKAYSWALPKGLPAPGEKGLAVRQPDHIKEYMGFSGKIKSGYGKGTVKSVLDTKTEILKSIPNDKIYFNIYDGKQQGRYFLKRSPKDNEWLIFNYTPTEETKAYKDVPRSKQSYKLVDIDKVDPKKSPDTEFWMPKLDGAHNTVILRPGKRPDVFSYRKSAKKGKLIDHTYRTNLFNKPSPPDLKETIVRGELYIAGKTGESVARLLNSNVWKSRELQETEQPLELGIFDVVKYKGKNVEDRPYREKLLMLQDISEKYPDLKIPPIAKTKEDKKHLLSLLKSKKHPSTNEGFIIFNENESIPKKVKFTEDYDLKITGTFPAKKGTKYEDKGIGGFRGIINNPEGVPNREISVGSGLTDKLRQDAYKHPDKYKNLLAKITSQRIHPSGKHQAPIFKEFRLEEYMKKEAMNTRLLSLKPLLKEIRGTGARLKRFGDDPQHKFKPKISPDQTLKGLHYSQILYPKKFRLFKTPVSKVKAQLGHELGHIKNLKAQIGKNVNDSPVTQRLVAKRTTPLTVQSEHQANLTGLSELKRLNLISSPKEHKQITRVLSNSQNNYEFLNKLQAEHHAGRSKPISILKAIGQKFKKNRYMKKEAFTLKNLKRVRQDLNMIRTKVHDFEKAPHVPKENITKTLSEISNMKIQNRYNAQTNKDLHLLDNFNNLSKRLRGLQKTATGVSLHSLGHAMTRRYRNSPVSPEKLEKTKSQLKNMQNKIQTDIKSIDKTLNNQSLPADARRILEAGKKQEILKRDGVSLHLTKLGSNKQKSSVIAPVVEGALISGLFSAGAGAALNAPGARWAGAKGSGALGAGLGATFGLLQARNNYKNKNKIGNNMTKTANKAVKLLLEKYAKSDSEKTYPISRAYSNLGDISSLGINKFIDDRARQGRAQTGKGALTKREQKQIEAIGKNPEGKTYPISRTLTNPAAMGALGGASGLMQTAILPGYVPTAAKIGLPLYGAVAGVGGAYLARGIKARAEDGRANKGRKGIGKMKQEQLKKIREAK